MSEERRQPSMFPDRVPDRVDTAQDAEEATEESWEEYKARVARETRLRKKAAEENTGAFYHKGNPDP